jgi:hypothetical protein
MRTQIVVPASTFRTLFQKALPSRALRTLLRRCGVRRRRPPVISATELIAGLVFHVVAKAGTLAQHVKDMTGKSITDGALSQRRALLPEALFQQIMAEALKPNESQRGQ